MKWNAFANRRLLLLYIVGFIFLLGQVSSPPGMDPSGADRARVVDDASRWLVVLMGGLRGGEDAWSSLYANALSQESGVADLALLIQEDSLGAYPNASLVEWARHVWTYPRYDDWADAIDLVNGTGWRETHLPGFRAAARRGESWFTGGTILFGPLEGLPGSAVIIFMIRWFLVQRLLKEGIVDQYDGFVVTRPDQYYLCPHEFTKLDLSKRTLWIPEGEDWGGYTDRHLVVGRDDLLDALDVMPRLIGEPFEFDVEKHHNSERFLKYVWTSKNLTVRRSPRSMFLCGTVLDHSGWSKADRPSGLPDVFVKYPWEHQLAKKTCGIGHSP